MLCQTLDPTIKGYDNHGIDSLGSGSISTSLPEYTNDQIADYLTTGFWEDRGAQQRSFEVSAGDTLTFNISGLDSAGRDTAVKALEAWTAVSGLQFQLTTGTADLTFDDNSAGAYAGSYTLGNTITRSIINVDDGWQAYGDYCLQTYIHEVGHALGLGHGG
ncbi:MAG: hypothetical protein AB3N11_13915, partial [Arenibacterium sp.]